MCVGLKCFKISYFSNFFAPKQNLTDSETSSEIADPESFKDFDYYIEKFSNNL